MEEKQEYKERVLEMYRQMRLIREYEEQIYFLFLEGILPGTIHQSHGEEATSVGVLFDLTEKDYMISTHRPAGDCIAKGMSINELMAEMFGKVTGSNKGKGGAMHTGNISVGALPSIAIVGGTMPISVGVGLSLKMKKTRNVIVCYFGDGAANEGAFHESLNAAAIWDLPIVFVLKNNHYGASTHYTKVNKIEVLSDRAKAYGMPGITIDGNNVLEVNRVANEAIDRARNGEGPSLIELKTYRIAGHSRNDACHYRDKEEEEFWFNNDPINNLVNYIIENKLATKEELDLVDKSVVKIIEESIEFAKNSPFPTLEDAYLDVYDEGGSL